MRLDAQPGQPGFGALRRCPSCGPEHERRELAARAALVSAECGLSAFQRTLRFDGFVRYAGNETAVEAAQAFGAAPGQEWLVIGGQTGNGKTHLLSAIANVVLPSGVPVLYAYVPDLLDWLRAGFDRSRGQDPDGFPERFERVCRVPLLLLDDLAAEKRSPWVVERLESIFDHRYREHLATAVSTNADVAKVRELSERIYSRLCRYDAATIVVNHAEPYHLWKARHPVR